MFRLLVVLTAFVAACVVPTTASAAATVGVLFADDGVMVAGGTQALDLEIDSPAANTIRVVDRSPVEDLEAVPGAGCTEVPAGTVTCAGLSAADFQVIAYGSSDGDTIAIDEGATFPAQLYGRGGNDVLLGGGAADRLNGGFGDDELDGRGGGDLVENGYNNSNAATSDDDSDLYRDTGSSGQDSLNYGAQTVGVHMKLDGIANDGGGAGAEGDDIRSGFERLRGTKFDDVIVGGPADEVINGSQGDDDITGGPGSDTIEGNEGVDTVRARDGVVDAVIDCDSASASSFGAGELAVIDGNDPAPLRCEVIDAPVGLTPTPAPSPTPAAGGPADPGAGAVIPVRFGPANSTESVSRMPRVTGKRFTAARDEVLKVFAYVDVNIEFKRGCKVGDFLEVTKQSPMTGAAVGGDVLAPAKVTLTACIAEADFLRDCDLAGVKEDVKRLGAKALDADVALTVLGKINTCKVDYDVKVSKQAEEARIALEAQRASEALAKPARDAANAKRQAQDKIKADLRASITCPIGGTLRIGVIDGYTPTPSAFGLKKASVEGDPEAWSLPSHPQKSYQSFLEIVVTDRAAQFPEARVFLDTDDVTDADSVGTKSVKNTVNGRASFEVRPQKKGTIKVCVVVETGGDAVVSTGIEIPVTGQPKAGTMWETQSGRLLKITKDGPVAQKSAVRASIDRAPLGPSGTRAAGGPDWWEWFIGLFSGKNAAVNAAAAKASGEGRVKLASAAQTAKAGVGQMTTTGKLEPNPGLPTLESGARCLGSDGTGAIREARCTVLKAPPSGASVVGLSNDATKTSVALGNGNVFTPGPGNIVPRAKATLIGLDGSTLIGNDGSTLIGNDGSTLIGNDGSTLIGMDGSTLIGNDGSTLIGNDGSTLIGNDGSTAIAGMGDKVLMQAPAQNGAG